MQETRYQPGNFGTSYFTGAQFHPGTFQDDFLARLSGLDARWITRAKLSEPLDFSGRPRRPKQLTKSLNYWDLMLHHARPLELHSRNRSTSWAWCSEPPDFSTSTLGTTRFVGYDPWKSSGSKSRVQE